MSSISSRNSCTETDVVERFESLACAEGSVFCGLGLFQDPLTGGVIMFLFVALLMVINIPILSPLHK